MNKLLIFTGDTCSKCRTLKKFLAANPPQDVEVVYENTSEDITLARQYNVRRLPSVFLLKENDEIIASVTGEVTLASLKDIGVRF